MIRQHQFYKVELVSIVEHNKCLEERENVKMLRYPQEIRHTLPSNTF